VILYPPNACRCGELQDVFDIGMGQEEDVFKTFDRKAEFGEECWWLSLFSCSSCKQNWLVASEQRIYDVWFLKRLESPVAKNITHRGQWPNSFRSYAELLKLANERGHNVRYLEPLESLELYWTIVDLALAKPGISSSELAELLPIDRSMVREIGNKAVTEPGVSIDFNH
jgi:hypothetical protein